MVDRSETPGFWRTAPGVLTAFAGVVTAIAGLVAVLSDAGVLGPDRSQVETIRTTAAGGVALRDAAGESMGSLDITGTWTATVAYPWGVRVEESFDLLVEDHRLTGTASYFGIPRALVDPRVEGNRVSFSTSVEEALGDETRSYRNDYRGLVTPRGIVFRLYDSHGRGPIEFTMRRRR